MQGNDFQKPKRLVCETETVTATFGRFWAEPLERGFGTTLGNALRRILLSSINGAAVTAIHVDNVYHEFSTIPDVVEDVTDIVLNIKRLWVKKITDGVATMVVEKEGAGEVTAGDIKQPAGITILNPDLHLFTLDEGAKIRMELVVQNGRGYSPAEEHAEKDQPIGIIAVDAIFSPIIKVNFKVEPTRVGQSTNYDKLMLEVTTDGSISPEDAVADAANILIEHFQLFTNYEESPAEEEKIVDEQWEKMRQNLMRSVDELELSVRAHNCLENANIKTLADLVRKTDSDMLKTRNFGRKSLNEIKEILAGMELKLGMDLVKFNLDLPADPEDTPEE